MKKFILLSVIELLLCSTSHVNAQGVGINSSGNSADPSALLDLSATNKGLLIPRMTTAQRNAINSPAEGLLIFNITTKCFEFNANGVWQTMFCSCSPPTAPAVGTHTPSATQIVWNWNTVSGATGYKYNTVNNYGTATDNGTSTSYTQAGLTCNTAYTLYVWAYNNCGNSPVATLTQTTSSCCSNAWSQLLPGGGPPVGRIAPSAIWDPVNSRMLMFGGINSGGVALSDLWSYSPSANTWTQLSSSASARGGHSAVYDAANSRMLVFAGTNNSVTFNDLWSYTPSSNSWAQLSPGGGPPTARLYHAAVWDAVNNKMLIFGGSDGVYFGDLWQYSPSGNSWSQLSPSGGPPSARDSPSAVWDAANNRMLMFGGYNGTRQNDVWSYSPSGNAWTQLTPTGPPPARNAQAAAWDAANSRMLVFGGFTGSNLNDLWAYSPSGNTWVLLNPSGVKPAARRLHAVAWNATNNTMLVFGGFTGSYVNDLWQYCP